MGGSQEPPVVVQGFELLDKAQRPQAHMPQCSHLAVHTPGLHVCIIHLIVMLMALTWPSRLMGCMAIPST